jgi:predicted nuclease of predicted toxin-antitoxin system
MVARLRDAGHDVAYVADTASGPRDADVLRQAREKARLLLTQDKDFGDLVFRAKESVPGLILIRIDPDREILI